MTEREELRKDYNITISTVLLEGDGTIEKKVEGYVVFSFSSC
jgi:predicted RNA-binding protein with TRAM domain